MTTSCVGHAARGNVPLCIFAQKRFARKGSACYRTRPIRCCLVIHVSVGEYHHDSVRLAADGDDDDVTSHTA